MPKTIKNIYDNSVSFENLLKAHKKELVNIKMIN